MKKLIAIIGLACLVSVTSQAQVRPVPAFSAGSLSSSTNTYNGTNYVAIDDTGSGVTSTGLSQNTPSVSYINAQSDKAASQFVLWQAIGNPVVVVSNTTTSLYVSGTNGLTAGYPIVISHVNSPIVEPRWVTAISTSATNQVISPLFPYSTNTTYQYVLTINQSTLNTTATGDGVYSYSPAASIAWGAATNSVGPASDILVGQFQTPLLVSLPFTTAGSINAVSGIFR